MNKEYEDFLSRSLRRLRNSATGIEAVYHSERVMFSRSPETQATVIVEGYGYALAAFLLVDAALLSGELSWENFQYVKPTGIPATKSEVIKFMSQLQEKRLKEDFNPLDVISDVVMPLVKFDLLRIECEMVNQGYQLPSWQRPEWLSEGWLPRQLGK